MQVHSILLKEIRICGAQIQTGGQMQWQEFDNLPLGHLFSQGDEKLSCILSEDLKRRCR